MTANNLKKDLKEKQAIFGLDRTTKELKKENVSVVYMASTCRSKEEVRKLAKNYGSKLVEMEDNGRELGVLCRKPFTISVLCFKK